MSLVIAIKDKDRVWIGCDSQVSYGFQKKHMTHVNFSKVWGYPNRPNVLMGGVGSARDIQLVQTNPEMVQTDDYEKGIGFNFAVNGLYPRIFQHLANNNRVHKDEKGIPDGFINSEFLFAYKGELFGIGSDGTVEETDDYLAIGCPEVAIGVLEATKEFSPIDRIIEALRITSETYQYVDFPFFITDTETMKTILISREDVERQRKKFQKLKEKEEKEFLEYKNKITEEDTSIVNEKIKEKIKKVKRKNN